MIENKQAEIIYIRKAIERAHQLHQQKQFSESGKLCNDVLARVPGHVTALHIHVMNLRAMGEYSLAEAALKRLTKHSADNNDDVLYEWGVLHAQQGHYSQAITYLNKVIALNPKHANACMVLGRVFDRQGFLGKAESLLRRAHDLRPGDETICKDLAALYARTGRREMAKEYIKRAYNLNPLYVDGIIYWASLLEHDGEFDQAFKMLNTAREIEPDNPSIACQEGNLFRRKKEFTAAMERFESIDPKQLNPFARATYYRQRGLTLERLEKFDEAFDSFTLMAETNTAPPLSHHYPNEAYGKLFNEVKAFWSQEEAQSLPRIALPDKPSQPLFIVGFPRSGTTLLEQILSNHSEVISGSETHAIESAMDMFSNLDNFANIHRALSKKPKETLQEFQNNFYTEISKQSVLEPGYRFFTEKTPLNETYLGLIHHALEEAPIIHMIRHPLNVVMSAFFNEVRHGRHCAATLESTATHYSRVMDLVFLYREKLEMNYLPVRYEDIVADHEGKAREIIDFIGLEWEDACAQFEQNKRVVRTPSYEQVSEKIYTRSVERYKPFLKHLEPVIPILEPYIERLGYSI
jgi:tetratricopeptide (TPR) repeat protein